MDIHNVTEFRNFIDPNNLKQLHPTFTNASNCVRDYEKGCNCWKAGDQKALYNTCVHHYQSAVGIICGAMRAQIIRFSPDRKLRFFKDGNLIGEVR